VCIFMLSMFTYTYIIFDYHRALLMYRADRGAPVPKSKVKSVSKSIKWIRIKV